MGIQLGGSNLIDGLVLEFSGQIHRPRGLDHHIISREPTTVRPSIHGLLTKASASLLSISDADAAAMAGCLCCEVRRRRLSKDLESDEWGRGGAAVWDIGSKEKGWVAAVS
jgi:hypothetical protein